MVGASLRVGRRAPRAAAVAALIAAAGVHAAGEVLVPEDTYEAERLAQAADLTGTPLPGAGPLVLRRFVFVASAAALDTDLYVADVGTAAVFRLERGLRLMTRIPGVAARPGTRVLAGPDQSLYVLDTQSRRVLRLSRAGQLLASYAAGVDLARPVDLALEEPSGTVLVADGAYVQIVAFHPLGGAARVVTLRGDERHRVSSIAGLAAGAEALYVSDPACGCIARLARDGRVLDTFGHRELSQPGPIAVDRHGRVFVADRFDRTLKMFVAGRLAGRWSAASLGLGALEDVRIAHDRITLAGGTSARVAVLRIREPAP